MDIISAKTEAAKESKAQKKPFYVFVDKEGEADISSAPLAGTLHKFIDGIEVKDFKPGTLSAAPKEVKKTLPAQSDKAKELINKKENVMEKKSKPAPKKAAKKAAPAKKSSPKKVVGDKVIRGNNMTLTKEQWAKVDAQLKKEGVSFSEFSRSLVLKKIGV